MSDYQRKYLEEMRRKMFRNPCVSTCYEYGQTVESMLSDAHETLAIIRRRRSIALRVVLVLVIVYALAGFVV